MSVMLVLIHIYDTDHDRAVWDWIREVLKSYVRLGEQLTRREWPGAREASFEDNYD